MKVINLLLACFIGLFAVAGNAQQGKISGLVKDGVTDLEIIGANVFLQGTSIGASTDYLGNFHIRSIPNGTYNLITSFIGYASDTLPVVINGQEELQITIVLKEDAQLLETVTVTAVRKTSTEIAVLSTIKESMQVVSGVSAESIRKTLDSDASQVVRRIPGVTVIGDRFVVIRGLNERYNSMLLHNINAPSMEPDVRSFSFDVLPSQVIDQVLIYKSPAPELPGDFSGGAVKIFTKGIPGENNLTLDVSLGYRPGSSFEPFFAEQRRSGYWTGLNDKVNDLPDNFPEQLGDLTSEQIDALGKTLPNNWKPEEYRAGMDYKIALTHHFSKDLGAPGKQIGSVTSLQYSNSKTIFEVLNRQFEAYDFTQQQSKLRYTFDNTEYKNEIMAGIMHNWAFRLGPEHVIEWKNLYNHLTTYEFINRIGEQVAQGFNQNNFAFYNEYRGLYTGQLIGTHKLFNETLRLEWIGGYGNSFNQLPDYRRYRTNVVSTDPWQTRLFIPAGQSPDFMGKFYSSMRERIYSGALNLEYSFKATSPSTFKPILKSGLFYENRDRAFEARNLGYSRGYDFDAALFDVPIEELFEPQHIHSATGIRIGENFTPNNFFDAGNILTAYYASALLPVGKRFSVFGGARVEDNLQYLRSPERFQEGTNTPPFAPVEIQQFIILPSAVLAFNITDNMLLKAVYGKTVNRPEFREIAPFGFYDFIFDATVTGNTFLKNARIDNFDLRWEHYPSSKETISFALFYKKFTDPIEYLYGNFGSEQSTFFFRNIESAVARGVELDVRKSLASLTSSPLLQRVSLLVNVSAIDSKVTLGEDLENLLRAEDRPLQGQSGFIVNSGLFYEDTDRKWQVNLNYNVIGKRILLVGAGAIPNTYEMPRNVLDLSISKGIGERLVCRVGVKDLLNQEFLMLQDGNEDGVFDRTGDQIFRRFKPGSVFSLGLSYKIF